LRFDAADFCAALRFSFVIVAKSLLICSRRALPGIRTNGLLQKRDARGNLESGAALHSNPMPTTFSDFLFLSNFLRRST